MNETVFTRYAKPPFCKWIKELQITCCNVGGIKTQQFRSN